MINLSGTDLQIYIIDESGVSVKGAASGVRFIWVGKKPLFLIDIPCKLLAHTYTILGLVTGFFVEIFHALVIS